MSKRVLVAMSGGVDSSAAAAILIEQGYEVEGAIMRLDPHSDGSAVKDAQKVADELGIRLHVFDFTDKFDAAVIEPFVQMYLVGQTPNPCVSCNKKIKFGAFLDKAIEMGFDFIATGHYARISSNGDRYSLHRVKSSKDQTYVLYNMTQHVLAHTLFPLAEISDKAIVRSKAEALGISVADKADSQEICFIHDDDYARFIHERTGVASTEGDFVDICGNTLGRHKGIMHYTVGQRKGLGISFGEPRFVVDIQPQSNRVVLGTNADTFSSALIATDANFISGVTPDAPMRVEAKIRYSAPAVPATLTVNNEQVLVEFDSPERAITPGQSVVFYTGDEVIGGAIIVKKCKLEETL